MEAAGSTKALIDRGMLDHVRVEAIAKSLEDIVALPDPVGCDHCRVGSPEWPSHRARGDADRRDWNHL